MSVHLEHDGSLRQRVELTPISLTGAQTKRVIQRPSNRFAHIALKT
jgi:hypothetical protein